MEFTKTCNIVILIFQMYAKERKKQQNVSYKVWIE